MNFNVGLIRVLTTDDEEILNAHGRIIEKYFPMLKVESKCILNQLEGVHDDKTKAEAIPKIIELAKQFEHKDAIIISCADEPGLLELKQIYNIPIIGAGSAIATLEAKNREKIGVLGISEKIPESFLKVFGDKIINLGVPKKVNSTLDLMTDDGIYSCFQKGDELKKAGASSIALACTGFSTVSFSKKLEEYLGIPVFDPVICEAVVTYFELIRRC